MNKIVFLAFLLFPISLFSRSIKGVVVNNAHAPIAYANVIILNNDSTFLDGVVTDTLGTFSFKSVAVNASIVKISCSGYDDQFMSIPNIEDLGVIELHESTIMLEEVMVKANLPLTRIANDALITTVSNTVLASAGTANDVLAKVPLVTGSDGEFTVFGCGTPVIYINGRIVKNTTELEQLSSRDIKSVEVISNPGSDYSSETKAVIKIKTIPPKGEGFSASLSNDTRIAHYALNTDNIQLKYRHGGLEVFANGYFKGGKRKLHEVSSMTSYGEEIFQQNLVSYTTESNSNIYGKFGFNYQLGENHSFGAYYEEGREKTKPRGTTNTEVTSDGLPYQELHESSEGKELLLPSHEANIYYNGTIGDLTIDFNGDFMQTKKHENETQTEIGVQTDDRTVFTEATNRSRLWAEKLVLSYPVWKGTLEIGEEYTNSHITYFSQYTGSDISGGNTKINENNIAAFAQLAQRFGTFQVGLGIRYEHIDYTYYEGDELNTDLSRTYTNWFPSLSISTRIKNVGLSFNLTSRTSRPSYRQLDGTLQYVNRYSYQTGNPALRSTNIYTAQVMAQWRYFFVQAVYGYEKNSIFYTTELYNGDPLVKLIIFENIPKYQKLQFAIGAQPTIGCWSPQITTGVFNSFYTTQFIGSEKKLNQPFFFLNWDNSISLPHHWVIDADAMVQTSGNAQNCYLKAVSYLNLGIRKSFFNDCLTIQLKANDILNNNNERILLYNGDIKVGSNNYHESRNIILSLRYRFNTSQSKYKGIGAGANEKKRF